jgi:hypothetical protein
METINCDFIVPNGAGADTEVTHVSTVEGLLRMTLISTPTFTNDITVELQIRNGKGSTYYKSGEKARSLNGDTVVVVLHDPPIPIRSLDTLIIENSADPGAGGGTVGIELFVGDM